MKCIVVNEDGDDDTGGPSLAKLHIDGLCQTKHSFTNRVRRNFGSAAKRTSLSIVRKLKKKNISPSSVIGATSSQTILAHSTCVPTVSPWHPHWMSNILMQTSMRDSQNCHNIVILRCTVDSLYMVTDCQPCVPTVDGSNYISFVVP